MGLQRSHMGCAQRQVVVRVVWRNEKMTFVQGGKHHVCCQRKQGPVPEQHRHCRAGCQVGAHHLCHKQTAQS